MLARASMRGGLLARRRGLCRLNLKWFVMNHPNRSSASSSNSVRTNRESPGPAQTAQVAGAAQDHAAALPFVTQRCTFSAKAPAQMSQSGTSAPSPISDSPGRQTEPLIDPAEALVELTERQKTAIELLAMGKPDRVVAETVCVHPKSVTRWRIYHAGFRAELTRRRQEIWGGAADRFRGLLDKAMDALAKDLADPYQPTRFPAVRTMLQVLNSRTATGKNACPTKERLVPARLKSVPGIWAHVNSQFHARQLARRTGADTLSARLEDGLAGYCPVFFIVKG